MESVFDSKLGLNVPFLQTGLCRWESKSGFKMENPAKMRCRLAAAFLCTLVFLFARTVVFAQCTPFGNPPQKLIANIVPRCSLGTRLGPWPDSDGTPRYACLYGPSAASSTNPLPLVVFLHPSTVTADAVRPGTKFTSLMATANVSDDFTKPGFILLVPEGRNITHLYPAPDASGPGWDNWYRQFNPAGDQAIGGVPYPENADAAAIDHFIAEEESAGEVDLNRVYVTGWSNGAAMAYIYGLSRPNIAAIGVYSAPDPFQFLSQSNVDAAARFDPCPQTPVTASPSDDSQLQIFNIQAPTYQVHNNCDIAELCPNGEFLESQLLLLGGSVGDAIISSSQASVVGCLAACGTNPDGDVNNAQADTTGVHNHERWPAQWTASILDFFRRHPLNAHP